MTNQDNGKKMWEQFTSESEQVLDDRFWKEFRHLIPPKIPPVDIFEDDKYGYVYVELPGLKNKDDIHLSFNGQNLLIEGSLPNVPASFRKIHSERHTGLIKRSVALPFTFDGDVRASYDNGLLLLVIPKVTREFKVPYSYYNPNK